METRRSQLGSDKRYGDKATSTAPSPAEPGGGVMTSARKSFAG
jgi:hypothetical protein